MAIACVCPVCERKFRVEDAIGGKTIACPECAEPIYVDPADRVAPKDRTKASKPESSKSSKKGTAAPAVTAAQIPPYMWVGGGLALCLIVGLAMAGGYLLKSSADKPQAAAEPEVAATPAAEPAPNAETPGAGVAADLSAFVPQEEAPAPIAAPEVPSVTATSATAEMPLEEQPVAVETPHVASTPSPAPSIEKPSVEPVEKPVAPPADPVATPVAVASAVRGPSPLPLANTESAQAQVASIQQILKDACYRCHGENGTNEGGMNYIVNLSKVRESLIRPGDSGNSSLIKRIASTDPENVMPPTGETPALTPEQIAAVRKWIDDGAPISAPQDQRKFINDDWIVKTVHTDLMTVSERSRRFIRYFTLTALYNSGVSDDELETYRLAFSKLINSLSWGRQVITPHRVDPQGTILRVDVRDLNWGNEIWEQIVGVNPYPYHPSHELAEKVYEQCASPEPWVRIDWFVFKASRPPLYHQILRIPDTEGELEQVLHVDAKTNIEQEKVVRAGFNRSGVSRNNRLIERHEISSGAYWKSYDFAANTGRQNLFEYPEGPDGPEAFTHDGGELIFTLPNGLLGFMLTDSKGQRLDAGPTAIVSDPATHDRTVINGLSCFSCHYAGFIQKDDEIRPYLDLNAKAFENSDYLKSIYPGQAALNQHYQSDGAAYLKALATLGITNTSRSGEPISSMSQRFQSELSVRQAAAEFGMTESEFYRCLERRPTLPRSLGVLRVAGGTLKRDAFTELYKEAMEQIRTTPEPSDDDDNEIAAVTSRKFVDQISLPNLRPSAMAMSADGSRLLVSADPNALVLLDTKSGETIGSAINSRSPFGMMVRFSPRGDRFITGGRDGVIQIWEVAANGHMKSVMEFTGHAPAGGRAADIQQMCISGDGSTVVSVCGNRVVQTWSLATGKPVRVLPEPVKAGVIASWVSADGRDVLLADNTGLAAFSPRNTRELKLIPYTVRASQQGLISPNGKLLAIASFGDLWLINTANGQAVANLKCQTGFFRGAAFSDQGRYVLGFTHDHVLGWRVSDQKAVSVPISTGYGPFSQFAASSNSALCAWSESGGGSNVIRLAQVAASAQPSSPDRAVSRTTRAGKFRAGDKAEILYGNRWTPVTVVNVISSDRVRIHWDGWGDNWDEDIDVSRIRRPESPSPAR